MALVSAYIASQPKPNSVHLLDFVSFVVFRVNLFWGWSFFGEVPHAGLVFAVQKAARTDDSETRRRRPGRTHISK